MSSCHEEQTVFFFCRKLICLQKDLIIKIMIYIKRQDQQSCVNMMKKGYFSKLILNIWGRFHQHVYVQLLCRKIPKA